ncbi:type II RES/Xre toxin-antitoxin system antitoxin [Mucilaginibacter sp. McL0603]|uniref:type II RES/Xre toxin-antitoxin system antitoxin n=1 Tax=Mucilaginibacter sp. McL0603 TaxID=3415670 RepID=UPI003CEA64C3
MAVKKYKLPEEDSVAMVNMLREGVEFTYLNSISDRINFTLEDWSSYLHLSERTIQRYKKEKKPFDTIYSEKIVQIDLLYKRGVEVFGNEDNFHTWMATKSIPLGNIKPKELLDTTYGINLVADELGRVEHGIFA